MTEQELRLRFQTAFGDPLPASALAAGSRHALEGAAGRPSRMGARDWATALIAVVAAAAAVGILGSGAALHSRLSSASKSTPHPPQVQVSQSFSQSVQVPLAQAMADSPEPLLFPTWLPWPNAPLRVQEIAPPGEKATLTILEYRNRDGRSVLIDEQHEGGIGSWIPGSGRIEQGSISGQPAVFFDFNSNGTPTGVAWQLANGHQVMVTTQGLTKAELVRVAESLKAGVVVPKTTSGGLDQSPVATPSAP